MGKLGEALRKKFKTPREAIAALGLDEKLLDISNLALDGAHPMKPTRLEFLATTRIARAVNPLLAFDAKVNYGPLLKGLNTKNLGKRKPTIMDGLKKLLKGKTLAEDEGLNIGHIAKLLDHLEHVNEPKSLDESVSEKQHKAMEAAAHGHSNLGIPKNVGEEFSRKDKGKSFDDMLKDWATGHGMSEDDMEEIKKMHNDSMPENALDEEETEVEIEQGEDEIEQSEGEEEAEDEMESEEEEEAEDCEGEDTHIGAKDRHAKDRHAKDRHAKDRRGAMDGRKKPITADDLNKAVQAGVMAERKRNQAAADARAFVRPYVGELPMALDSSEKILRAAATALEIEDADTVHASALKTLIKTCARPLGQDSAANDDEMAMDSGGDDRSLEAFFPDAGRVRQVV